MTDYKTLNVACWNEVSGRYITAKTSEYELYKSFSKYRIKKIYQSLKYDSGNFQLLENGKWNYYYLLSETTFYNNFSEYIVRRLKRK
jgi:hypothetical protein